MRSLPDSGFDDMHGVDALRAFDPAWLGLDSARASEDTSEPDHDSVWLECNGELLATGSVKVVGVHKSRCGFKTLLFICPRCNEPHESVRFR